MNGAARFTATVVGIAAIGLIGWLMLRTSHAGPVAQPDVPGQPRPKVVMARAKREAMAHRVSVNATVEPWEQADLYGKVVAYVADVRVDIGDAVKTGDLLISLDAPELTSALHQAQAALAAQTEAVRAAEASVERARRAVDVAGRDLDVLRSDLRLAGATLNRKVTIGDGRAISAQELDEARAKADSVGAQVAAGEARVAGAQADLGLAQASLELAKAQREAAAAQVEQAATMVGYLKITAPFDGVVVRRYVDRGAIVHAPPSARAGPLLSVQRVDTLRVACDIPERDAAGLHVGDAASVRLLGPGGASVEARVSRIAGAIDPASRTLRAQIDLPNPDGRIRAGMYAQVAVQIDRRENLLTVPASAILNGASGESVLVTSDGRLERRSLKTGLRDSGRVEVLEGLAEGDAVVVTAKGAPALGSLVEPVIQQ